MSKLFGCAVALCAMASVASADDLRLDSTPFSAGNGGEFMITQITGFVNSAGITGLAADLSFDTFETFCVEHDEVFHPGSTYRFVVNTGAVLGGGGSIGGFDALDPRTAFLYTYFRNGVLPLYDYGAGRAASAMELQQAIWYIEEETNGVNNAFVALADAAVGVGGVWEGQGIGNARVLNLYDSGDNNVQDQLTLLPAPGAIALLGLAGVVSGRRRR